MDEGELVSTHVKFNMIVKQLSFIEVEFDDEKSVNSTAKKWKVYHKSLHLKFYRKKYKATTQKPTA